MKFITDFLNSGTVKQQNRKKLGALLICATAALLVVALIGLAIFGIAGAIKNKNQEEESEETGDKIPTGYVTTTFDEGTSSNGLLLLIDESHPYVGSAATVQPNSSLRVKTEGGEEIYKGAYGDINLTQETLDAFNQMMLAFHTANKDQEGYRLGSIWLASHLNGLNAEMTPATKELLKTGCALIIENQYDEAAPSIYDVEAKTGKGVYKWIYDNAAKYGFVKVADSAAEGNVFRYVGVVHAKAMEDRKVASFAEYLTYLQTKTNLRSQLSVSVTGADGKATKYSVYYLASDVEHYVPEDGTFEYTVSGDNMGGYIVTVNKTTASKTNNTVKPA
ncbi:MAG: hypothetical protein J6Q82_04095 [Clostridia bacterium]|nr:hypothetical protein [Clostridia bacterium]